MAARQGWRDPDYGFLCFFVKAADAPAAFLGAWVCLNLAHGFRRSYEHEL